MARDINLGDHQSSEWLHAQTLWAVFVCREHAYLIYQLMLKHEEQMHTGNVIMV